MARIRTIKPAFFTSEDVCRVSPLARLLFLGLLTEADREGRLDDKPTQLKIRLLPVDTCDVDALLWDLVDATLIRRYTGEDGRDVIQIRTFADHQRPHPKEPASDLPTSGRERTRSAVNKHGGQVFSPGSIPSSPVGREGDLREGDLREGKGTASPPRLAAPLVTKRNGRAEIEHPRFDVPTWWHLEKLKGLPGGEAEMARFYAHLVAHVDAHPQERTEPRKAWLNRHFEAWLEHAADEPPLRVLTNEPVRTFGRTDSKALLEGVRDEREASAARRRPS